MKSLRILALAASALLLAAPVRAQDADTPLDKALQQVETLLATLKAQAGADPKLVERLEEIAANLHKEKDARSGKKDGGPPETTGVPAADAAAWSWARDEFYRGLELKEEERAAGDQVLMEFVVDYKLAKDAADDKSKGVIRDHTEKRIARTFAARDANKLKDNLDGIIKRWEWAGGGRRGR